MNLINKEGKHMSKKMLIVYYSASNGNTKRIAEMLQKTTGADIECIETVIPYAGSYNEIVDQGKREVDNGFKPEIKPLNGDVSDFDVIAVGTPTWWYTMAPAVLSFLSENNWNGKTVIPFMTNGGWPGRVIKDMKKACKGATFEHEKEIQFDSTGGDRMETPKTEVEEWIKILKLND